MSSQLATITALLALLLALAAPMAPAHATGDGGDERATSESSTDGSSKKHGKAEKHGKSGKDDGGKGKGESKEEGTSEEKKPEKSRDPKGGEDGAATSTGDTAGESSAGTGSKDAKKGGEKDTSTSGEASAKTDSKKGGGKPEKCVRYRFEYVGGGVDAGEYCGGNNVPASELTYAKELHVSCSDTFSVEVWKNGTFVGWTTDGKSDLGGHVIHRWYIEKDRGSPCGPGSLTPKDPPPSETCEAPLVVKVRHADTGAIVTGAGAFAEIGGAATSLDTDGVTAFGTWSCGTSVTGRLTSPPDGYRTVTGSSTTTIVRDTGGTLTFTVDDLDPKVPPSCTGPLMIEVRHADTGRIVAVAGATATIAGTARDLDADGITDGGSWACPSEIRGTLDTPPAGYTTVDGSDTASIRDATGDTLVFTVRRPSTPGPCTGPLVVEVRDVSGELVRVGGAVAEVSGTTTALDADGRTSIGRYTCGTTVTGRLITPPTDHITRDGTDRGTITSSGTTLVFTVVPPAVVGPPLPPITAPCVGEVTIEVRGPDGELLGGAEVLAEDQLIAVTDGRWGAESFACGDLTVRLTDVPDGYTPDGPTTSTTTVDDGSSTTVTFRLVPVDPSCIGELIIEFVDKDGVIVTEVDGDVVVDGDMVISVEDGRWSGAGWNCRRLVGEATITTTGWHLLSPPTDSTFVTATEPGLLRYRVGPLERGGIDTGLVERDDPPTGDPGDGPPSTDGGNPAPNPPISRDGHPVAGGQFLGSLLAGLMLTSGGIGAVRLGRRRRDGDA